MAQLLPHEIEGLGRVPLVVRRQNLGGCTSEDSHGAHGESFILQSSCTKHDPAPTRQRMPLLRYVPIVQNPHNQVNPAPSLLCTDPRPRPQRESLFNSQQPLDCQLGRILIV